MHSNPSETEWHANLSAAYGDDKATAIIAALRKSYPEKSVRTLSYICSGRPGLNGLVMRNNVAKMARLKHEQNAAPAFTYYFTWQTQILDGVPRGVAYGRAAVLF
jgi:para-nitrobenzyl esterase